MELYDYLASLHIFLKSFFCKMGVALLNAQERLMTFVNDAKFQLPRQHEIDQNYEMKLFEGVKLWVSFLQCVFLQNFFFFRWEKS